MLAKGQHEPATTSFLWSYFHFTFIYFCLLHFINLNPSLTPTSTYLTASFRFDLLPFPPIHLYRLCTFIYSVSIFLPLSLFASVPFSVFMGLSSKFLRFCPQAKMSIFPQTLFIYSYFYSKTLILLLE